MCCCQNQSVTDGWAVPYEHLTHSFRTGVTVAINLIGNQFIFYCTYPEFAWRMNTSELSRPPGKCKFAQHSNYFIWRFRLENRWGFMYWYPDTRYLYMKLEQFSSPERNLLWTGKLLKYPGICTWNFNGVAVQSGNWEVYHQENINRFLLNVMLTAHDKSMVTTVLRIEHLYILCGRRPMPVQGPGASRSAGLFIKTPAVVPPSGGLTRRTTVCSPCRQEVEIVCLHSTIKK